MTNRWLPIGEFARRCGVSVSTARRWADDGTVDVRYTHGGHRRFSAVDSTLSFPRAVGGNPVGHSTLRAHDRSRAPGPARRVMDPITALRSRIEEARQLGVPVTIERVDETGRRAVATIPSWTFSLQWVKENLGGGRFAANGVEFLVAGAPRPGASP